MTKRILLLDTGKEWGGGTNSMIELLKRIDRRRFDVTALFYRNYPKGRDSDLERELAAIGLELRLLPPMHQPLWAKFAKELTRGALAWNRVLRARAVHAVELAWRIRPRARSITRLLREGGYDLLYMNNQPASNLEGYFAAEQAGIPAVQHCRIDVSLKPQEVLALNRVARSIICVSHGVADSLIGQGVDREKCCVVTNAIDSTQTLPHPVSLPNAAHNPLVIGSVGSLMIRKANDHLLRAAALLRDRGAIPLHLLIVGDGPQRSELVRLAAELGLAADVTFAGFQQAPLPWVATMDILVLSSVKEGLPRVILEAMLLSKPVVASDIVGSRELVRDGQTGLLYPFGDIEALAGCLQRLAQDPDLRARMGRAGRTVVEEEYSIERYVAGVEAVLAQAIAP